MKRLFRRVLVALVVVLFLIPTAVANGQGSRGAQADLVDIEDEVMCIVCKRPLSTSSGDAAETQRVVIQRFIDEGLTKQQVKDRLVVEYGDKILVNGRSPIAAAAPVLAAIVGGASVWLLLRRRRTRSGSDPRTADTPSTSAQPEHGERAPLAPTSAEDDARIDAELAERG